MSDGLERHFQGRQALQKALESAGVLADVDDIAEAFARAQRDQVPAEVVISALFEDEPRFESPVEARLLFSNLFGLWDLVSHGGTVDAPPKERPKKPEPAPAPGQFAKEGPSDAWVEAAWRHIDDAPKKEKTRWEHAFDNRQDALLTWLDDSGLSDEAFATARHLLFELHTMIELGWSQGIGQVLPMNSDESAESPASLKAWVDEAAHEAELDEQQPLAADEVARLKAVCLTALSAMWRSRRSAQS